MEGVKIAKKCIVVNNWVYAIDKIRYVYYVQYDKTFRMMASFIGPDNNGTVWMFTCDTLEEAKEALNEIINAINEK